MNILFVFNNHRDSNPFVITLAKEMALQGHSVEVSCSKLWSNDEYDIIHFQWPESIYDWSNNVTKEEVLSVEKRLIELKQLGKKIVVTCHNLKPHTNKGENVNELYRIIYNYSDLFIHLGSYSYELLSGIYKHAKHVIIPHHIYDSIYLFNKNKQQCKHLLKFKKDGVNILCFGKIRTDEERKWILNLQKDGKKDGYNFICPGFYRERWYTRDINKTIERVLRHVTYKLQGIHYTSKVLNDEMLENYFTACDIVMIPRKEILNSGNLPMGFFAGKVVIGPNCGNVGRILKDTGNPTFDSGDCKSISSAISKAIEISKIGKGEENRNYALKYWNTKTIVKKLIEEYNTSL